MGSNVPVSDSIVRQRTARYVAAVLEASGMNFNELKRAIGGTCSNHIKGYVAGKYSPSVEKILRMYGLTDINPDDYDLPIMAALDCVERMREMFRKGHTVSEFSKALRPLDYKVVGKLIGGQMVTTLTLLRFQYYWHANNAEKLVQGAAFRESCAKKDSAKLQRDDAEYQYIARHWGALAETAREIRSGLWEWFTDTLYRMELEHLQDNIYEFRAFLKTTGELSVKREVTIV
jgi:hypothetical protein